MEEMPGRPAESGLWRVRRVGGLAQATRLLGGPAQHELDLPVKASQIVIRPALKGLQQGRVDTKKKRLALSHATY
jgi:hypothetical protein